MDREEEVMEGGTLYLQNYVMDSNDNSKEESHNFIDQKLAPLIIAFRERLSFCTLKQLFY